MNVFFTASLKGVEIYKKEYQRIYEEIEKLGYKHLDDEIFKLSQKYYREIEKKGKEAYIDLYSRKIKHLEEADIIVFECSFPSFSIGYMIQKALDFNKPIIILYLKDNVPHFLSGIEEDRFIIQSYNLHNITKIIKNTLKKAGERKDKRFNFFVSPKILTFLEKQSSSQGMTKTAYVRGLIIESMKKNNHI